MHEKTWWRWLGLAMVADGLFTLLFARDYVRLWRSLPWPLGPAMHWLLRQPSWGVRAIGLGEMILGARLLARARETYGFSAPEYSLVCPVGSQWLFPEAQPSLGRAVAEFLPVGGNVLDLGCGTAANLDHILALKLPYGVYTGVDLSEEMLAQARQKFAHLPQVSFRQMDLLRDTLPSVPYDLVLATWVLGHVLNPRLVIDKAWTRLRPGGHMVLLFLSQPLTVWGPVLSWVALLFGARALSSDIYRNFPGQVRREEFGGGWAMLMVLRKDE